MRRLIQLVFLFSLAAALTACQSTQPSVTPTAPEKNLAEASRINIQLGLKYLNQGNTMRAKQKLLTALHESPSAPAYTAMAYFYQMTGEPKQAGEYYLKAINEDPKAGAAHNNYGAYLCREKQYQAADEQFQLAVADSNYLNVAGAYENAGLCAMLVPDATKATDYFEKALQQNPNMTGSLLQLAHINADAKNYVAAQSYLTRYLALAKPDAATLSFAIDVAQQANDVASAAQYINELKTKFPDSAEYKKYQI